LLFTLACAGAAEPSAASLERRGLLCIRVTDVPVPADAKAVPLPGADFETGGKTPSGWGLGSGQVLVADAAPQGRAYARIPVRQGLLVITPRIPGVPGSPHFLWFWLRSSTDCWAAIEFGSDETMRTAGDHYPGTPSTGNQWRRVGYYFWLPSQCQTLRFHVRCQHEALEGGFIAVDDFQLRTASEAEMSAAYEAERANLPPYEVAPWPDDGRNLALSVAKWEGRAGLPGKPFLIWAVGSSWTNFQGDGYPLIRTIRERFPSAPPIAYKKHAGSGTPWDFAHGWIRQFVNAEQPDLIFTYTNGSLAGLNALLTAIRRSTTADVIVPSLHFFQGSKVTSESMEVFEGVPIEKVREVCRKHGAEFVENRRELAGYLQQAGLEPEGFDLSRVLPRERRRESNRPANGTFHGLKVADDQRHRAASDDASVIPCAARGFDARFCFGEARAEAVNPRLPSPPLPGRVGPPVGPFPLPDRDVSEDSAKIFPSF